jgi:hypothetical protein
MRGSRRMECSMKQLDAVGDPRAGTAYQIGRNPVDVTCTHRAKSLPFRIYLQKLFYHIFAGVCTDDHLRIEP